MSLKKRVTNLIVPLFCLFVFLLSSGSLFAADSVELVKQIQKSFSSIKRQTVTAPQKAASELSATMVLFEELKDADPANAQISRFEEQIAKLNQDLEKRLGRSEKPSVKTAASQKAGPAPEAAQKSAAPVAVSTTAGADLPSAVTSRIKKIDQSLDKVKEALAKQSVQRAQMEFKAATKTYEEIQARYQDKAPADHPEMVAVAGRIAVVNSQLETAVGSAAAGKAAEAEAVAANQALADTWIARMEPFISRNSNKYIDPTGWGKEAAEFAKIRQSYGEASAVFADYQKVDFPLGKTMGLKNAENSLRTVLDDLRGTYAKEDTAKASEEWLNRLEPFVTSMGAKNLIVSFTSSVEQMQSQKMIFDEAGKLFAQYQKAEFPQGKSPDLQRVADELADRLAKFPETLQRSLAAQSGNVEQKLDQEIAFLESKQEWKSDAGKRPYCLSDERINEAQQLVDTAVGLLPAGDPGLAKMQEKMATLIKMNDERRKIHAERTRMIADKFTGDGKSEIMNKAEELVIAKISGCKVLRSTVISEDWQEESVKEWTDTTQTVIRYRTTRSVSAQVAAKKTDGEVRLYTLHIAKDRRTDGSWGKLYGNLHSDIGDLILEKNVNQ
ncbi:MAG: hypothetical protein KKB30_04430 [Proteobacteria bacterium]|nr:hypothetical protein [Pseudomonadota bacterium]MBU1716475.1 hypothetical protein [Pseudomonadota bacterium]